MADAEARFFVSFIYTYIIKVTLSVSPDFMAKRCTNFN